MISQKQLRQILKEYRVALEAVLGDDLHSIILYGSQARGDAVEGSTFFAL
jgi:predicted nucleotidyltransferase